MQQVYAEAKKGFENTANTKEKGIVLTREDKVHGSLLVMQELIRNSSSEGEVLIQTAHIHFDAFIVFFFFFFICFKSIKFYCIIMWKIVFNFIRKFNGEIYNLTILIL